MSETTVLIPASPWNRRRAKRIKKCCTPEDCAVSASKHNHLTRPDFQSSNISCLEVPEANHSFVVSETPAYCPSSTDGHSSSYSCSPSSVHPKDPKSTSDIRPPSYDYSNYYSRRRYSTPADPSSPPPEYPGEPRQNGYHVGSTRYDHRSEYRADDQPIPQPCSTPSQVYADRKRRDFAGSSDSSRSLEMLHEARFGPSRTSLYFGDVDLAILPSRQRHMKHTTQLLCDDLLPLTLVTRRGRRHLGSLSLIASGSDWFF